MAYWGHHLILDCGKCDSTRMSDYDNVDAWIRDLVVAIDMQPIGSPRIEYTAGDLVDKAGFTVVQVIVTSSITAHFVDAYGQIYLDVFSCKEFDPKVVESSISHHFGCTTFRKYFLTRQAD